MNFFFLLDGMSLATRPIRSIVPPIIGKGKP